MSQNTVHTTIEKDAYTLRDLLQLMLSYLKELWQRKWWIVTLVIICTGYMVNKASKDVVMYNANLTYVLNQPSANLGAISGLLGSFGLNRSANVNLDKVVELSKSRTLIQNVLFTKITIDTFDNRNDFIANHLLNLIPELRNKAMKVYSSDQITFPHDSISKFNKNELTTLKIIYEKVSGTNKVENPVFMNGYDENTGILTITASTPSESLSIQMCNLIFDGLKDYYILTTTKGNQRALDFVQTKVDSIYAVLKETEFKLTSFNDRNRNVTDPNVIAQRKLIDNELVKLKAMYGEVTKNQELADFSLTAGTPEILIIDAPIAPLETSVLTLTKAIVMGIMAGMIAGIFFFSMRKLVLDALRSPEHATT
jgi:hypothetical protein